jgi:uncharacterized protein YhaN
MLKKKSLLYRMLNRFVKDIIEDVVDEVSVAVDDKIQKQLKAHSAVLRKTMNGLSEISDAVEKTNKAFAKVPAEIQEEFDQLNRAVNKVKSTLVGVIENRIDELAPEIDQDEVKQLLGKYKKWMT